MWSGEWTHPVEVGNLDGDRQALSQNGPTTTSPLGGYSDATYQIHHYFSEFQTSCLNTIGAPIISRIGTNESLIRLYPIFSLSRIMTTNPAKGGNVPRTIRYRSTM